MRRLALAALPIVLALGCNSGTSGGDAPTGGRVGGTIRVQASGGDSEIAALREMAEAFETAHPGTTVELTAVAEQGEHIAKLLTSFAGGAPPDVFLLNYRRLGPFVEKDVIDPARLGGEVGEGDLYEPAVKAFTFDGRLACVPQNVSSIVTYVNPALFTKAGVALPDGNWTVAEALTTARALSARGVEAIGFDPVLRTLAPFVWSAGGEVVDDEENPTAVTLDGAEARAAIQFLLDLQTTGLDATERAAEEPQDRFARGELAMFFDSRRSVPAFRKAEGLQFDVRPLPRDKEPASLLASDGYCVTKASKNKATAHAFASFAVGPKGGEVLARTGRTVPSVRSLAESPVFLDPGRPPASSRVFLDVIPSLRELPSVAAWNEAEEVAGDVLTQLFAGRFSADAAVERIEKDTRAVLTR
jgi:multiple sugar transport system substrate-binding protein